MFLIVSVNDVVCFVWSDSTCFGFAECAPWHFCSRFRNQYTGAGQIFAVGDCAGWICKLSNGGTCQMKANGSAALFLCSRGIAIHPVPLFTQKTELKCLQMGQICHEVMPGGNLATLGQAQAVRAVRSLGRKQQDRKGNKHRENRGDKKNAPLQQQKQWRMS